MSKIDQVCGELWEATEFVAIVTNGQDGAHVVGNWGEYVRKLGLRGDTVVFPAGRYHQTEENLRRDNRVKLLIASRQVAGSHGPGQGCEMSGTAELLTDGPMVEEVKRSFPWARGALVVHVEEVSNQL